MKMTRMVSLILIPLLALPLLPLNALAAEKVQRFCTMDGAVQQLLNTADIPEKLQKEPVVQLMAEDIIASKLAERPADTVKIVWKDIYDMRGSVNARLAHNGHPLNYAWQALDAVGAGLTGTVAGKFIMMNSLVIAGPAGFIMLGGMNIVQETFQCNPSGIVMAANAGATVVVLIPWCKVPGVSRGCVALESGISSGIEKAAASLFGKELTATLLKETTNGVMMAVRRKSTDLILNGMEILNYLDQRKSRRNVKFETVMPAGQAANFGEFRLSAEGKEINWDNR